MQTQLTILQVKKNKKGHKVWVILLNDEDPDTEGLPTVSGALYNADMCSIGDTCRIEFIHKTKGCQHRGVSYDTGYCLKCHQPITLPQGKSYYSSILGKWISHIDDFKREMRIKEAMKKWKENC